MNIPNLPDRWDLVLFILGFVAVFFNQGNNWMILFGVFLMGVGVILGASEHIAKLTLNKYATESEVKEWIKVYFSLTGIFFFMFLFILGMLLFNNA
jgi:hypothetical protein